MEQNQISSRLAKGDDKESVFKLIDSTVASLPADTMTVENYKKVAALVLEDVDWGFFILCENSTTKEPLGLMYFTYEASDWRNGVFFWL